MALGCTVEELLARISSKELTEWQAYEQVAGPVDIGSRLDERFAMLASVVANVNRGKAQKPYRQEEFLPPWAQEDAARARRDAPAMTGEDMLRAVKSAHGAITGGRKGRGRGDAG